MKVVPAFLLVAAGAVGLVAVLFTREPAGRTLLGERPAATDRAEAQQRVEEERDQERD
ncbi:hypothetical protein [Saccharopolyspora sp. NPDC050642]|uniref:hypothetical protein n=1 Tax=Saccharopolyspora sp. NPDC050642 TaxID=3157099 RepID=UPI0033E7213B